MERINPEFQEQFNEKFLTEKKFKPQEQLIISGARQEYLAWTAETKEEARIHLDLASADFRKILELDYGKGVASFNDVQAAAYLIYMPIVEQLTLDRNLANLQNVSSTRSEVVQMLYKTAPKRGLTNFRIQVDTIFGMVALSQYWETDVYKGNDILALPAFVDQPLDGMTQRGDPESHGNVYIFTQDEESTKLTYKIFVCRDVSAIDETVPDEMPLVLLNDLVLPGEETYTSAKLIDELYRKQHTKLQARANIFMDVIDTQTVGDVRNK